MATRSPSGTRRERFSSRRFSWTSTIHRPSSRVTAIRPGTDTSTPSPRSSMWTVSRPTPAWANAVSRTR